MQKDVKEEQIIKIEMLTSELERCSHFLQDKSIECEQQRIQSLSHEQRLNETASENKILKKEYLDLAENLKAKVVDLEQTRSKLNRIQQITIKDYNDTIERLVQEIQKLNKIVENQVTEQQFNRQATIVKIQELQDERQKNFHLENHLKQIKNDKLEALHHLQLKNQENEQLQKFVIESLDLKIQVQGLLLDLDTTRKNYAYLYEQHTNEVSKLNSQLDNQRLMHENDIIRRNDKHIQTVQQMKLEIQQEINSKVQSSITQLENQVSTLNNLLEAKNNEIVQLQLNQKKFRLQENESCKRKDLERPERSFINLEQQEIQALNAKIIQLEVERNRNQTAIKDYETRCLHKDKDNMENENKIKSLQYEVQANRQTQNKRIQSLDFEHQKKELDDANKKIKYLLSLLDKKESQILEIQNLKAAQAQVYRVPQQQNLLYPVNQDRPSEISQYQMSISNMFYHQADDYFPVEQSRI